MSEVTLDVEEQIARIRRALAEGGKLHEKTDTIVAGSGKMQTERDKLAAAAAKLYRVRAIAPWRIAVVMASSAAAAVLSLLKSAGVL